MLVQKRISRPSWLNGGVLDNFTGLVFLIWYECVHVFPVYFSELRVQVFCLQKCVICPLKVRQSTQNRTRALLSQNLIDRIWSNLGSKASL